MLVPSGDRRQRPSSPGELEAATPAIKGAEACGRELGVAAAPSIALIQQAELMMLDGSLGSIASTVDPIGGSTRIEIVSLQGLASVRIGDAGGAARAACVKLSMPPPVGGREQLLTFEFQDVATGSPISDLEPYLGAVGHLLLVSADLQTAAHSHPVAEMSAAVGPTVVFQALFPRAGASRFWVQFQRRGRVLVAPFTVVARPREQIFAP